MRQLELRLFPGEPWDGKAPRFLTKSSRSLFSRREPQKDDRIRIDPDQMDLFHAALTPLEISPGAPLLLEPEAPFALNEEG